MPPSSSSSRAAVQRAPARGPGLASKLPAVTPHARCRLRLLRHERIKDYLLIEQELIMTHKALRPESAQERKTNQQKILERLRGHPLQAGTLEEVLGDDNAIITLQGSTLYVGIMSFVDRSCLEPGTTVLCRKQTLTIVGALTSSSDNAISIIKVDQAPEETYADIGGLDEQIQEIKEAVELPLTRPELYDEIGITPPKGVILYGEPGTGKTLLAKAVANATSATFLYVVGSELIQKYLGEGPKLVRQLFSTAREMAPSIIFIDEVDAVGTKRYAHATSGGEREVERTMLELLNQLDGFDALGEVKIILATNRIDALDPALIRPGRIDRKIHFTVPDAQTKLRIFHIHTKRMNLDPDVHFEGFIHDKDSLTGADIKAICMEAGLIALSERRMRVTQTDFLKAKDRVLNKKREMLPPGMYL